jgi:transposase
VYPANEGDVQVFARVFDALVKRLVDLEVATDRLIMVFDRRINSKDNFEKVREAMHVIAVLNRQQAQKLFQIPQVKFEEVGKDSGGKPVLGFPTRWFGFEQDWRVLITYRKARAEHEEKTWKDVRTKVLTQVEEWRKHPSLKEQALWAKLTRLIPKPFQAEFAERLEAVKMIRKGKEVRGYLPVVQVVPEAEKCLQASFGKTAIITDLEAKDFPDPQLVEGFVARAGVEEDFKWLKDRHVMSVKPFWVWHDATVAGHTFLCVMGLMLLRYLQWELRDLDLSIKELVEGLEKIRVLLVRGEKGRTEMVLERISREGTELFTRLNLGQFIPGSG